MSRTQNAHRPLRNCSVCGKSTARATCPKCRNSDKQQVFSVSEAAELLGVSIFDLKRLVKSGVVRSINTGSVVRIQRNEIESLRRMTRGELAEVIYLADRKAS